MRSQPSGAFAAQVQVCPDSIYRDLRRLAKRLCRRSNSHHLEDVVRMGADGRLVGFRLTPEEIVEGGEQ